MKKKVIFVAFCLVLFLIFTALGYAWSPKERFRGDPWEHILSPKPDNDRNLDLVVLAINSHFYLIFKSQSKVENFNDVGKLTDQKSASSIKPGSLNTHETRSKK